MTAAANLGDGRWLARCAKWEVRIEGHDGRWSAALSLAVEHRQMERPVVVLKQADFVSATDAAKWAEKQLKDRGQIVLLLSAEGGPPRTLVDMLQFEPDVALRLV